MNAIRNRNSQTTVCKILSQTMQCIETAILISITEKKKKHNIITLKKHQIIRYRVWNHFIIVAIVLKVALYVMYFVIFKFLITQF